MGIFLVILWNNNNNNNNNNDDDDDVCSYLLMSFLNSALFIVALFSCKYHDIPLKFGWHGTRGIHEPIV